MNFDFSDEQIQLRNEMRRLLDKHGGLLGARRVLNGSLPYDCDVWSAMAEMGVLGAAIPEEFGGLGTGYLELCVTAEELGRNLTAVPMSSSIYLASEFLKEGGSDRQKQEWLPLFATGKKVGTFASAEGPASSGIKSVVKDGEISGVKLPVPDGAIADVAIVMAFSEPGHSGVLLPHLVDLTRSGILCEPVAVIDPSRRHAKITFDRAPCEPLVGFLNATSKVSTVLDRAAVLLAFEQVAGADRALEMARDYALQRMAFGRQIGAFQAIKHLLADMFVSVALARSNAYYAAWALQTNAPDLATAAATARVSATQAFHHCARNNIQVHGGMGYTWEYDCHLFYRRAHLLGLTLGPQSVWEDQLIDQLCRAA